MKYTLHAIIFGALFLCHTALIAQEDDRITVAVYDFTYNPSLADPALLTSIKQYLVSSLQQSGQFKILNRGFTKQIEEEMALQRGRSFVSSRLINEGKSLGAKYIITGNVDRLSITKSGSSDANVYGASISFLLMFLDVETGELIASEVIDESGGGTLGSVFTGSSASPQAAISKTLGKVDKEMSKFIDKYFGARGDVGIISIEESSNIQADKVLISGGSDMGLKKKSRLIVYVPTKTTVEGVVRTRKKNIGELKVVLVEDGSFSICEVTDGNEKIFELMEEGKKLYVFEKESKLKLPFGKK